MHQFYHRTTRGRAGGEGAISSARAPRPRAAGGAKRRIRPRPVAADSLQRLGAPGADAVRPAPWSAAVQTKRVPPPKKKPRRRAPAPAPPTAREAAFVVSLKEFEDSFRVDASDGEKSDDDDAGYESGGSMDDWIVADDRCVAAADGRLDGGDSNEARWAAEGASLLDELRSRPSRPKSSTARTPRADAEPPAAPPEPAGFYAAGSWGAAPTSPPRETSPPKRRVAPTPADAPSPSRLRRHPDAAPAV